MIFQAIGEMRPYPAHNLSLSAWAQIEPQPIELAQLVTTKRNIDLAALLAEDSTFYGDLFIHVVRWRDTLYLEDGLQRTLRAALQQHRTIPGRILELDPSGTPITPLAALSNERDTL